MLEQLFSELDELMQGSFRRARRTICSKLTALFVYEFYVVKSAAICSLRRSKVETQNLKAETVRRLVTSNYCHYFVFCGVLKFYRLLSYERRLPLSFLFAV